MTGNPYSLQPVIDYIQDPDPEDSQMGRKMMTQNPSVIVPVVLALHNRIELYKEVNVCSGYCWPIKSQLIHLSDVFEVKLMRKNQCLMVMKWYHFIMPASIKAACNVNTMPSFLKQVAAMVQSHLRFAQLF